MTKLKAPPESDASDKKNLRIFSRFAQAGLISLEQAARELGVPDRKASTILVGLHRRGWLKRVRRGLYLILPLEAEARTSGIIEDPWALAIALFEPCYIGGWSAAEHWGLTEQLFRSTFVASAGRVRRTDQRIADVDFHTIKVSAKAVASVDPIWRGRHQVAVSSPERTIADGLTTPSWLGGIRHLAEILENYRQSPAWNPVGLLAETSRGGAGAAFKRLGFLAEALELHIPEVVAAAKARRTSGIIKLDPTIQGRGRLVKRWGLWVNADVGRGGRDG